MITFILPAYNESESIVRIIKTIRELYDPADLIVVDDCSTDNTAELVKKQKSVRLIQHKINKGYSASLKTGIKEAWGDYICILDADGTYHPEDIPKLDKHRLGYDMVVGARDQTNVPTIRKPAKFIIGKLANYLTNVKIPDINSGLRIFKKDLAMEFYHLYPERFSFTTTITLAFLTSGYTVKYVPIQYSKRKGKSSIKPTDFINFINLILRIVTYFNPFKVFFTVSLVLLAAAFGIFLYSNFVLGKLMDVSVIIVTLSALQVFLFGLIADLIVKSRR